MPDTHDELDRMLDAALGSYADPGAESGLERRILSRIAAEEAKAPRRRWLWWAMALPVAASLLLFVVLAGMRKVHAPSSAVVQRAQTERQGSGNTSGEVSETHPISRVGSGTKATATEDHADCDAFAARLKSCPGTKRSSRRAVLQAKEAALPKQDIFPTPHPLSPQEQALVDFAAHASQAERDSLIAAQQQADAPIHIASIQIQPLEPPSSGAN